MPADRAGILRFWRDAGSARWFAKNQEFDDAFRARFLEAHYAAARRELDGWADDPEGALALLILLDQFPRNAFRGTAHMFATDPLALAVAQRAVERDHAAALPAEERVFLFLPFMHAEDLAMQELCVRLCEPLGGSAAGYAVIHRDVVARFGRFPHRNPLLGRDTTAAERDFLAAGGFAG